MFKVSQFNKMYLCLSWKYKKIPNRDSINRLNLRFFWRRVYQASWEVQIDCNHGIVFNDSQSVIYFSECKITSSIHIYEATESVHNNIIHANQNFPKRDAGSQIIHLQRS